MQIITLTSDMGLKDHYVASLKGRLLSELSEVHVIDISHQVNAFDIIQAAYYLSSCLDDFPKGTIHVICVESEPIINLGNREYSSLPAILEFKGQYIVSMDNGIFSLIAKEEKFEAFWNVENIFSNPSVFQFPAKNILIPIAIKIAQNVNLASFATKLSSFKRSIMLQPIIENNLIRGNVIHIDIYGNVITNIDKETFYRFGENTPFTIFFRSKNYYIDTISKTYNEVTSGERLAFFNTNNFLEIAINKGANEGNGGASNLFGLDVGDIIRVEFSPEGSKTTIEELF